MAGRDLDKTYVHIIQSARTHSGTFQELLQLAPWNDPQVNVYAVEITKPEFNAIQNGSFPLTWGKANLPKWQWNGTERGSWSDAEDDQSTWQTNTPIPDDRWIVKIYDRDPGDPQVVHLGIEELDEDPINVTRFLKLFNPDDSPNNTNAQDQKIVMGDRQMIFSFSGGEATFEVARDKIGNVKLSTDHRYRVVGPTGEMSYLARVFGRVLRVSE